MSAGTTKEVPLCSDDFLRGSSRYHCTPHGSTSDSALDKFDRITADLRV